MFPEKRRNFLKALAALPVIIGVSSCNKKENPIMSSGEASLKPDPQAMELSRKMGKEQVYSMLEQRAKMVMERSYHCAQSTFFTLSEQFGLGGDDVLKALTPLPGMAERGETCGAMTGALMAMGMIYGREKLEDWNAYRASLQPTNLFCQRFEKELGSTTCCQIQERAFGRSFNLMDMEQLKEFQKAGATEKCTRVVQKATRIAAEIILDDQERT